MNARKPIHILLVEDNPGDARLVVEAFREAEVESCLHWVTDVDAAFLKLEQQAHTASVRTDVVILDLHLPRKDGRRFLADLRSQSQFDSLAVAVMTTSAIEDDRQCVRSFANTSFHTKPMQWSHWVSWAGQIAESCASRRDRGSVVGVGESHRLAG